MPCFHGFLGCYGLEHEQSLGMRILRVSGLLFAKAYGSKMPRTEDRRSSTVHPKWVVF